MGEAPAKGGIVGRYRMVRLSLAALLMAVSFGSPVMAADVAAGNEKSVVCQGCHGADGISLSPEVPNLAGQKEEYLAKAIGDYRSGVRKNPIMGSMVGEVSDADAADIAAYFSSLKPTSAAK